MTERRDVYVRYSRAPIAREFEVTIAGIETAIVVDVDMLGDIVGIELLDAESVEVNGERVA